MRLLKTIALTCAVITFTAGFSAQAEEVELGALIQSMEQDLAQGNYEKTLAKGMPAYRRLARDKYNVAAVHAYARNLAIIKRSARETIAILSRMNLANKGTGRRPGNLLDAAAFYRSLSALGRIQQFPAKGFTPEEMKFLALLHTAMVRACHRRVLESLGKRKDAACNYVFAYVLATREPERYGRMLNDLPHGLRTQKALNAFARYCAGMNRKDMAAAICFESGKLFPDESVASAFYNKAADYYLELNDVASVVRALKMIVAGYPDSKIAPKTQVRIIDAIANRWKAYGTAIKECKAFLEQFPDSDRTTEIQLRIGYLHYQNKDYEAANKHLADLSMNPEMKSSGVQIRFLSAFCHMGNGDNEAALEILEEIVEKHPKHPLAPRAQYVLAKTYLSRQDYVHAQDELKRLTVLYPSSEYTRRASDLLQRLSRMSNNAAAKEQRAATTKSK